MITPSIPFTICAKAAAHEHERDAGNNGDALQHPCHETTRKSQASLILCAPKHVDDGCSGMQVCGLPGRSFSISAGVKRSRHFPSKSYMYRMLGVTFKTVEAVAKCV